MSYFIPTLFMSYALALFQEPMAAYEKGGLLLVAVVMFIANFMQNYNMKSEMKDMKDAFIKLAQSSQMDMLQLALTELAKSNQKLSEGLTDILREQQVLATNQTNLTSMNSEIMRELLGMVKDDLRS